ncbi:MAG: hypothetical protein ACLR8L_08115 [Oscillospiraceae bacterium]
MPILLKTQVESTAKTPVTACRARVGGLCGFRRPAERVPAGSPKTGRCTDVRERCRNAQAQKKNGCGRISAEGEAASGEAGERPDAFLRPAVHFCPQCGQFRGMKMALFCGCQKWNDAVISQKPQKASKIKDNFDAITISGGFEHENRRTEAATQFGWKIRFGSGCRNTTKATDAARKTNSLQKQFCFTAAICRANMPETSCRKSSEKRWKLSSVCSVTASASCF